MVMIMPLTSTTAVQRRARASRRRITGSSASANPVCAMPSVSRASVGGIELLSASPGTPIIATG